MGRIRMTACRWMIGLVGCCYWFGCHSVVAGFVVVQQQQQSQLQQQQHQRSQPNRILPFISSVSTSASTSSSSSSLLSAGRGTAQSGNEQQQQQQQQQQQTISTGASGSVARRNTDVHNPAKKYISLGEEDEDEIPQQQQEGQEREEREQRQPTVSSSSAVSPTEATKSTDEIGDPTPKESKGTAAAKTKSSNPYITALHSPIEFVEFIENAPANSLTVIEYYSQTCPTCRKVSLKYQKIAKLFSKMPPTILRFGQMEYQPKSPDSKQMFRTLGIDRFPFVQIWRNRLCVASHGTENASRFEPVVKDTIVRELDMSQQDWDRFLTVFENPVQIESQKFHELRTQLEQQQQQQQQV